MKNLSTYDITALVVFFVFLIGLYMPSVDKITLSLLLFPILIYTYVKRLQLIESDKRRKALTSTLIALIVIGLFYIYFNNKI